MYFTITFRSFTPQPGGLEFQPGQDYYFICKYCLSLFIILLSCGLRSILIFNFLWTAVTHNNRNKGSAGREAEKALQSNRFPQFSNVKILSCFSATSSKDDLHRRIGGRCSTNNMKVVFKVCCRPEDIPTSSKQFPSYLSSPLNVSRSLAISERSNGQQVISK